MLPYPNLDLGTNPGTECIHCIVPWYRDPLLTTYSSHPTGQHPGTQALLQDLLAVRVEPRLFT